MYKEIYYPDKLFLIIYRNKEKTKKNEKEKKKESNSFFTKHAKQLLVNIKICFS